MEPLIAQTLGCMLNIDNLPGLLTWVGGIVTLGGILAITIGGFELEKEKLASLKANTKDDSLIGDPKEGLELIQHS